MSKRAAIYARVSTDEQAETGYGLPYQSARCHDYAQRHGYTVVRTLDEDFTGKVVYRPRMNELLEMISHERIEVVIIHRTDRLGRRSSVQDILEHEIEARGARVEYVTANYDRSTAQGRAMRRVQGVFDEFDYEAIIEKLREHKVEAVKHGRVLVNRPPYGYRVVVARNERGKRIGSSLEVVDEEAAVVRQIFDWYVFGDECGEPLSITAISDRLSSQLIPSGGDRRGLRSRKRKLPGSAWHESHINKILRSETYIGRWYYGRTKSVPVPGSDRSKQVEVPREHWLCVPCPAIVDEELFKAASNRAATNTAQAKRNRKFDYLFSGIICCAHCSTSTLRRAFVGVGGSDTSRGRPKYRCSSLRARHVAEQCTMPYFFEDELDRVVWQWVQEIVVNPDQVEATLAERETITREKNVRIQALIDTVDRLIEEKQIERDRLLTLYKRRLLDEDRWYLEDAACQREIEGHQRERVEMVARMEKVSYTSEYITDVKELCRRISTGFQYFTREEKRRTYELLDLQARLAVEDGLKVVYVRCVLNQQRLSIQHSNRRHIASSSSR